MSGSRILILSPHRGIAEGLSRLLTFDGRYDVRRAASGEEAERVLVRWHADAVLLDGVLLRNGARLPSLSAPTLILTGRREDADPLMERIPALRAWLRKDATYAELAAALDGVGAMGSPLAARRARILVTAVFSVLFGGVGLSLVWLLLN